MSMYQPLADFLAGKKSVEWDATFAEVERALGRPLPQSAYKYPAWWANQSKPGHSQTHGWRSVGWRTAGVDLARRRVRFEREEHGAAPETPAPASAPATPRKGDDKDALVARARALTGLEDEEQLIAEALRALIARAAAMQLAAMGGTMPDFAAPARERP